MMLKILCTPDFTEDEISDIDQAAAHLGVTAEEVIRKAVSFFVAQCVPTQGGSDQAGRAA